ncbi:MAG: AMP-binding protein [Sulfitobacter sp.]
MTEALLATDQLTTQDSGQITPVDSFSKAVHYGPKVDYHIDTFWRKFRDVCSRFPDKVALKAPKRSITYQQLLNITQSVAARISALGWGNGQPIGLFLNHSENNAIGSLAALAADGHFVPINLNDPDDRIRQVIANCGLRVILTDNASEPKLRTLLDNVDIINLDDPSIPVATDQTLSNDIAAPSYILHTSGSTGVPKGVVIGNGSWVHFCKHIIATLNIREADKVLMATSYTFDVSVMELGIGLLSGATLVVPTIRQQKHPGFMRELLISENVTAAYLPQRLALEIDPGDLPDLRVIYIGGEAVLAKTVCKWITQSRDVYNIYGPSETTVAPIIKKCAAIADQNPPIGKPIANHFAWLEGPDGNPIATRDQIGEIIVGGIGVGIGYNGGDPVLNAPFSTLSDTADGYINRTYRTGDLGYWDASDDLNFVGRADQQVSVAGVRIELLEVETAISKHPDVAAVVVLFKKAETADDRDHLKAIIQTKSGEDELADFWTFMRNSLPSAMIPQEIEYTSAFQYSSSGKLIRPKS